MANPLSYKTWTYYIQFPLKELFWRLKKYLELVSLISQAVLRKKLSNLSNFLGEWLNFYLSVDIHIRVWVRVSFWSKVTTYDIPKISRFCDLRLLISRTVDSIATHGSFLLREKVYAPRTIFFKITLYLK